MNYYISIPPEELCMLVKAVSVFLISFVIWPYFSVQAAPSDSLLSAKYRNLINVCVNSTVFSDLLCGFSEDSGFTDVDYQHYDKDKFITVATAWGRYENTFAQPLDSSQLKNYEARAFFNGIHYCKQKRYEFCVFDRVEYIDTNRRVEAGYKVHIKVHFNAYTFDIAGAWLKLQRKLAQNAAVYSRPAAPVIEVVFPQEYPELSESILLSRLEGHEDEIGFNKMFTISEGDKLVTATQKFEDISVLIDKAGNIEIYFDLVVSTYVGDSRARVKLVGRFEQEHMYDSITKLSLVPENEAYTVEAYARCTNKCKHVAIDLLLNKKDNSDVYEHAQFIAY